MAQNQRTELCGKVRYDECGGIIIDLEAHTPEARRELENIKAWVNGNGQGDYREVTVKAAFLTQPTPDRLPLLLLSTSQKSRSQES